MQYLESNYALQAVLAEVEHFQTFPGNESTPNRSNDVSGLCYEPLEFTQLDRLHQIALHTQFDKTIHVLQPV